MYDWSEVRLVRCTVGGQTYEWSDVHQLDVDCSDVRLVRCTIGQMYNWSGEWSDVPEVKWAKLSNGFSGTHYSPQ